MHSLSGLFGNAIFCFQYHMYDVHNLRFQDHVKDSKYVSKESLQPSVRPFTISAIFSKNIQINLDMQLVCA